ncbi:MAG: NAD-dependent epimerase/dehydratase family protein [Acidobacteria bacterium]|nr:NAD-dependent epimerase/dehydratase family protein [Acidobacteriota bacterium]
MKVLVTGGTGFVGANLARVLLKCPAQVRLLVRPSRTAPSLKGAEVVPGDVLDAASLQRACRDCDVVFHAAALVKTWVRDRSLFERVNVDGFRHLLDAARAAGVRTVVYTSSFLALGPTGPEPRADTRPAPSSGYHPYERTKRRALEVAEEYLDRGMDLRLVFPCVVYGPGERTAGNLISKLIEDFLQDRIPGLLGDGSQVWNYVFVEDVVRGHLRAGEAGRPGGRYILGGENATVRQFFGILGELTGKKPPARHIPFVAAKALGAAEELLAFAFGRTPRYTRGTVEIFKQHWAFSSEVAERELGYTHLPLRDGLRRTVAWLAAARSVPRESTF